MAKHADLNEAVLREGQIRDSDGYSREVTWDQDILTTGRLPSQRMLASPPAYLQSTYMRRDLRDDYVLDVPQYSACA